MEGVLLVLFLGLKITLPENFSADSRESKVCDLRLLPLASLLRH